MYLQFLDDNFFTPEIQRNVEQKQQVPKFSLGNSHFSCSEEQREYSIKSWASQQNDYFEKQEQRQREEKAKVCKSTSRNRIRKIKQKESPKVRKAREFKQCKCCPAYALRHLCIHNLCQGQLCQIFLRQNIHEQRQREKRARLKAQKLEMKKQSQQKKETLANQIAKQDIQTVKQEIFEQQN